MQEVGTYCAEVQLESLQNSFFLLATATKLCGMLEGMLANRCQRIKKKQKSNANQQSKNASTCTGICTDRRTTQKHNTSDPSVTRTLRRTHKINVHRIQWTVWIVARLGDFHNDIWKLTVQMPHVQILSKQVQ